MKKCGFILAAALVLVSVFSAAPVHAEDITSNCEIIYRMYNPNSGEHFYTSNAEERAALYLQGWDAEDIGWIAPGASSVTTPVYRLYTEGTGKGGDHHYTTNEAEKNYLLSIGWKDEGILCQAVKTDDKGTPVVSGTIPLYRNYNPNAATGAHNYTTSGGEAGSLTKLGWADEGIAWYAVNMDTSSIALPELPKRPEKPNIENTDSYATIEADMKLNGGGTGCHAKLVFQTATAAVSFGIQHDMAAVAPYTGLTYFICENVASNAAGGQSYSYYNVVNLNEWHKVMMTYTQDGTVNLYIDGTLVGTQVNTELTKSALYCSVEGSARLDGDSVDAEFRNIKIKGHGTYDPKQGFNHVDKSTNPGITVDTSGFVWSTGDVHIYGTIVGLGGADWDSAYDRVSGVAVFSNGL